MVSTANHAPRAAYSSSAEADIAARRIHQLYTNAHVGPMTSVGVGLIALVVFQLTTTSSALQWWFALLVVAAVLRSLLNVRFKRAAPPPAELPRWHRYFTFGVIATGALFGSIWWLVGADANVEHHLLLGLIISGMSIGAVSLLGASMWTYTIYLSLLIWPGSVWLATQQSPTYLAVAALSVVFYLAMLFAARGYHRNLVQHFNLVSANQLLHAESERLADFARMGADLFWEADSDGRFTWLSEGSAALTGIPAEALVGKLIGTPETLPLLPETYLPGSRKTSPPALDDHTFEWTLPDGRVAVLLSKALPVVDAQSRTFSGLRGTVRDITMQHRLAAQLQHQATHDDLTDLVNRREFERRLDGLLVHARSHASTHAVCYLDLDQFKVVNDSCGHAAGDALLRRVATELRRRLRGRDTLARLGGDEFGVLLEHCAPGDAGSLAAQLHACVEAIDFVWQGQAFHITASVGLTLVDARSSDLDAVMSAADAACYAAKNAGRNRVHASF